MTMPGRDQSDWKPRLRRKIAWLLAFKAAALTILWLLFFSPDHRPVVDPGAVSRHLAPAAGQTSQISASEKGTE